MKTRPDGLDDQQLRTALREFGIDATELGYAPVGHGDHHWTAVDRDGGRWFVTLADLAHKSHCGPEPESAFAGLRRAMDTAAALRALDLVVAPVPAADGASVLRLADPRYALSVFPLVPGAAGGFGEALGPADRSLLIAALARLHTTRPPAGIPVHHPDLSARPRLEAALADLDAPWSGGPYTGRVRELLAGHAPALRRRLAELDELVARPAGPRVVTHGEPHPGNLLRTPGCVRLVDWDTVALAAPERDLWLTGATDGDLAHYAALTGHTPDPGALALHRLRWALEDVDAYLHWFRSPHTDSEDARDSWAALSGTVRELAVPAGG
ncbi:phosphotransferase [Kitasatospora sp. NPDC058170]|uniref:phosphotransferase n=1 Tax=Kitasatospora sp. NPDC058170 TaxID=3346364 RepID=UPI0036D8D3F4